MRSYGIFPLHCLAIPVCLKWSRKYPATSFGSFDETRPRKELMNAGSKSYILSSKIYDITHISSIWLNANKHSDANLFHSWWVYGLGSSVWISTCVWQGCSFFRQCNLRWWHGRGMYGCNLLWWHITRNRIRGMSVVLWHLCFCEKWRKLGTL